MTVDPPRRLRPRAPQRRNTVDKTKGAPSAKGTTGAARPVSTKRIGQQYVPPVPASPVTVGDTTGQTKSIAIVATTGTSGTTIATGYRAVAFGDTAEASGTYSTALGAGSTASGNSSLALGVGAVATGPTSVGIINNSSTGHNSFAFGPSSDATADEAIAFGSSSQASGVNSWASSGATASGDYSIAMGTNGTTGALAANDYEIALGMASHIAIIKGKLVIADGSGGLHQIVVSTGGALSTVAYP